MAKIFPAGSYLSHASLGHRRVPINAAIGILSNLENLKRTTHLSQKRRIRRDIVGKMAVR
jgi:hypothetical protein